MTQSASSFEVGEGGQPFEKLRSETKILDVKVNEPLPSALFAVDFQEGDRINDQATDPSVSYRYKAHMTPEEWTAIVAEGTKRAQRNRAREQSQTALLGRAAPEFSAGATWLNGAPLKMKDLAGKVIILDFWAEWCGPCRHDLPALSRLYQRRPNDLVVIGVHPPGSELDAIHKVMKEFMLEYPTCIDVPAAKEAAAWGTLYAAYAVDRIPHTVLIDRQGNVAATGALRDVLGKASALAGKSL